MLFTVEYIPITHMGVRKEDEPLVCLGKIDSSFKPALLLSKTNPTSIDE
jgi:hypothetical protein